MDCTAYRSLIIRLGMLLLLIAGPTSLTVLSADEGDEQYGLARGLYKNERWELAAERLRAFLKDHPQHPSASSARLLLGLSLVNLSDFPQARTEFERFVRDHPQNANIPDAKYRIAECSYLMNELKSADSQFREFLSLAPKHALVEWALPYLADTQLRLGQANEAAKSYERSLQLHPRGAMAEEARYGLARAYDQTGRPTDAQKLYLQIIGRPQSRLQSQARLRLGLSYFNQREFQRAATVFDELATREPNSNLLPLARLNAGYAFFRLEDFQQAIDRFESVPGTSEHRLTASYWSARSHLALRDYNQAVDVLTKARTGLADDERTEQIEYLLGLAYFRAGQIPAAHRQLLMVAAKWPSGTYSDDALHYATESLVLQRQWTDASKLVAQFEAAYPNSPLRDRQAVLKNRIRLMSDNQADVRQATRSLEQLLTESSDSGARDLARIYLAKAMQEQQQHERALELLKPLMDDESDDSNRSAALVLSSASELAQGNYQQASELAQRYLQALPDGSQAAQARSVHIMATARSGNVATAQTELAALGKDYPGTSVYFQASFDVAEQAYAKSQWADAAKLFEQVQQNSEDDQLKIRAASGLAWSEYQQSNYAAASKLFATVSQQQTVPDLVAEASFMLAKCMEQTGRPEQAQAAFEAAFKSYLPKQPMAKTDDLKGPSLRAYEAGKTLARMALDNQEPQRASQLYQQLIDTFPNAPDRSGLLESAAFANLEAEEFAASDALFEQLLRESPSGPRADTARYQLAESQLVINGNLEQARQGFDKLARDEEVNPAVRQASYTQLLRIAAETEDWKTVQELAHDALKWFPEGRYRNEVELHLAESDLQRNNVNAARVRLDELRTRLAGEIVNGNKTAIRTQLLLAEIDLREKDYDAIDGLVERFERDHPKLDVTTELSEIQGRALKNRAEFAKARAAFQKVLDHPRLGRGALGARSQFLIAETWFFEGQHKKALDAYWVVRLKFTAYPEWVERSMFQIAQCDEAMQNWDKAARSYDELLKAFPKGRFAEDARQRSAAIEKRTNGS